MKFAKVDNKRIEATKGATGICPVCGSEVIARCGEIKIHHWSHKTKCTDHWWENETEWHRNWKNQFPKEWQEVVHFDDSGEKHIADIKTPENWVVEFQHSAIKSEERRSRNEFYNKDSNLIWVVDGTRRKTDVKQFAKVLIEESRIDAPSKLLIHITFPDWSNLIMEWKDTPSLMFLDFNDELSENKDLWLIYPRMYENGIYLSQFSRDCFVEYLNNNKFDEIIDKVINPIRITVEHLTMNNEKRNSALEVSNNFLSEGYLKYSSQPKSYLGNLKLPNNILSKIDIEQI